jgi:HEAT repeat protein/beta-lactamase regulating signal transducer with metallopeptidase domain
MRADLMMLTGSWLFTYVVHSTLLLGGVWLLCRRRVAAPALRENLWKVAMIGGLLTSSLQVGLGLEPLGGVLTLDAVSHTADTRGSPGKTGALPDSTMWGGQLLPSLLTAPLSRDPTASPPRRPAMAPVAPPAPTKTALESTPASQPPTNFPWLLPAAVSIWASVAAFLCLLYLVRRARAMRGIGPRQPVTDEPLRAMLETLRREGGVRRPILITSARGLGSPVALGRSEIVLPEAALTELDVEQQRSMLAHELAHLARRDPAWLTTACVLERVFFLQPLNRVARAGLQESAELLCDDWAVHRTGSGFSLATCLVKVAEWVDTAPRPVPLAGMAEHRSQLANRIHRLIEGRTMPTAPRSLWLATGAVLLLGVTAVAAPGVTTARRPPADPPAVAPAVAPDSSEPMAALEVQAADTDTVATAGAAPRSGLSRLTSQLRALEWRVARSARSRASLDMARAARAEARAAAAVAPLAPWSTGPMPRPVVAPRALSAGVLFGGGRERDTNNIAVPALIVALKDSDVEVRRAAVNSLCNLDDPRAVPGLIDALKDSDAEVRAGAARALGSLEDKRAVPGLVAALKDGNKDVREAALSALHSMPEEVPDEAILGAIGDSDPDVRAAAIGLALHRIQSSDEEENAKPDPRYVSAFTRLLSDPTADIRQQAAEALGSSHLREAPAGLLAAAKDKNADVRQAVAGALGRIGDARAVPTLKEMLQDSNADVRECAVGALGEIRDRSALEALVSALKSSDPAVRRSAAEALGQRGD